MGLDFAGYVAAKLTTKFDMSKCLYSCCNSY